MQRFTFRAIQYAWLLGAVCTGCVVTVDGESQAVPQRPTIAWDTDTTAAGEIQVETGITVDPGDLIDTPVTIRYGRSETQEFFASFSPYQRVNLPGSDKQGMGDIVLGIRERVIEETDERPSVAWLAATKLPTGREAELLSTGELDFLAAGSVTKQVDNWRATGFYQLGLLGDPGGSDMNLEHTLTVSVTGEEVRDLIPFGELAGVFDIEQDSDQVIATLGVYKRLSPSLILDAGIAIGLTEDAESFQFLIGMTSGVGYVVPLRQYDER